MADNDALLEKFQTIIKARVSTITKNSDTNTAEIKKSITGIKQDISQNTEKIKEVNTRVDEVTDELKERKRKINDLENAGSPSVIHGSNKNMGGKKKQHNAIKRIKWDS